MSEEKENADIFSKAPNDLLEEENISSKRSYILIGISLLLILIALIITLIFVFKLNEDEGKTDESPIDINSIISFYQNLSMTPKGIRESIKDLSWKNQMGIVLKDVFET